MRFVEIPCDDVYYRFHFRPRYEDAELREHQNHAGYSAIDINWAAVVKWLRAECGGALNHAPRCHAHYQSPNEFILFREADDALAFKIRWG